MELALSMAAGLCYLLPSSLEYLGEAEPCRSVLLDFIGVLTFSGTTRLVLTSPNMS